MSEQTQLPLPSATGGLTPVAAYVRMSTEHQQYSTENQLDRIKEYAARRNMEIVRVFADEGTCSREQGAQHYLIIEDGCVRVKRLDGLLIKTELVMQTESKTVADLEKSNMSAPTPAIRTYDYELMRAKEHLGPAAYEGLRVELIVDIIRRLQLPIADVITELQK